MVNWYKETDEIETCKGLDVLNSTAVDAWVRETVNQTLTMGQVSSIESRLLIELTSLTLCTQDGLLFDIEGTRHGCWDYPNLTRALIKAADAMHAANPASLVLCKRCLLCSDLGAWCADACVLRRLEP